MRAARHARTHSQDGTRPKAAQTNTVLRERVGGNNRANHKAKTLATTARKKI
jgi:hypothetical protein